MIEREQGRLLEARACHERSREIAQSRGDTEMLGGAAQNISIVCQEEGKTAQQCGDEATARGDDAQAVQWEAKRHEVETELAHRAQGGEAADTGLP